MVTTIVCPCCSTALAPDHPGRRGILINRKAALGAKLTELEWQLAHVPKGLRRGLGLGHQLNETKAELAAVTEQLNAETKG